MNKLNVLNFYCRCLCARTDMCNQWPAGRSAVLKMLEVYSTAVLKMLEVYTSHHSLMQFTSKQGKFSRAVYSNVALCDARMLRCNNFAMRD